ncbi:MAG: F0F1 ATP synthase subunit B [Magnetococcales bacterium]|nr:F0F1 ATP synthase subunit B [Magnetococcales bacterium]MBF0151139.1 F0F1 ATP synthase subunit B [Magnetococcales bacterium]MBF0174721.1 F0F1 ATP synthase subunit B [Magnetococcales bacterium]MBF0346781.1 F0F1 ATP synthase subunit B [Magnetococcales bacterium]MBF0630972.1 F0F1 ATP synthase subunit B [Magnetococcales bacterium]
MIATAVAATAEHTASSGMPQFEPSVFGHQIFWSIASFFILLYLLKTHVLPAIEKVLDARGNKIRSDLENAEQSRRLAEKAAIDTQKQLNAARRMAEQTIEEARLESARYREMARESLSQELAKKKSVALAEIETAKQKAMTELHHVAVDIAMLATEKLIAKNMTKTETNKMVQEAIAAIQEHKGQVH